MSKSDETTGLGCLGLIAAVVAIGIIIEYWLQITIAILGTAAAVGLGSLLWRAAGARAAAAQERQRCTVCTSWSRSVVLTDLEGVPSGAQLCPTHSRTATRLAALEAELLDRG